MKLRSRLLWPLLALALGNPLLCAQAQTPSDFPNRPLTLVIPFPPGGATDVLGRLIGKKLGELLGQSVVIDNRPGAGTIIGASYVSRAPADGYTLLMSSGSTFTINPAIQARLPYDPIKSFEPIGIAGRTGLLLLANPQVPASTVKQFVDLVKAAPDHYAYGSFGRGTTAHFAGEMMLHATGLKMQHVPYKGSAPAMVDLLGGQIPFAIDTVSAGLPQLKNGKLKAIAITTARRSSVLPQVPTLAESGYPEIDIDAWLALVAPHGLPPAVKTRLESALAQAVADPATRAKLIELGFEPSYENAAAASAQIEKELPLMRATAQRAHIQLD